MGLKNPSPKVLKRMKEKDEKLYNKIAIHKDFYLDDVLPGKREIKRIDNKENIDYFAVASSLELPFDKFGIIGYDLEGLKREIEKRGESVIEKFSENKEKYLPYLPSILGYASVEREEYKDWVKEILGIENFWEFKTSHLEEDLKSALVEIKDLKMETKTVEEKPLESYVENLKAHMEIEKFNEVKERVGLLKKENQEKALRLIEKTREIINLLMEGGIPSEKDISSILAHKGIFKRLNLSLTFDSVKSL